MERALTNPNPNPNPNPKLKLVMKGDERELWIASLTTWNFITVQRNRRMLIVNKHCAIVINLY